MTIREALDNKVARIRQPHWIEEAYLKLDLLEGGFHGPWGHLYSRGEQQVIGEPTPQNFLVICMNQNGENDFERYTGELDEEDKLSPG